MKSQKLQELLVASGVIRKADNLSTKKSGIRLLNLHLRTSASSANTDNSFSLQFINLV